MKTVKLIYKDNKDKELFELLEFNVPVFIDYINMNTLNGIKEGKKILGYYGTSKVPFIEILEDNQRIPFYSENGNPIYQIKNYLNG